MPYSSNSTTLLRPPVTVVVERCVEASPLETYTSMVVSTVQYRQAGRQAGKRGKRPRLVGGNAMSRLSSESACI